MADQAKGKGIAPKRASNPADPGQSSRPPPPIRTLLEDKEDGKDYSEVIEVLKQHIKSHKRPAKITLAIRRTAAYKAKRRELAKACAIVGRAAAVKYCKKRKEAAANAQAYKLAKKEGLQCSKRTTSGNTGRYTTDSGFTANKDDNNAYNRAYMPSADIEEEEGSSSDNNGVNGGTSNNANKGEGSSAYKRGKGALYYEDILLCK
ncbi:hypothetical protein P8C59_001212 [Phyllachora maydis]|uniref:Uncharacterized protein n=1 Tax=Phyllachora maydis TaxID=1825666 RepID=A0AAD9HXR0_9PEZI|nr:hypothetical protein P8C59_001212 [Phyllachora maydis]